MIQTALSIKKLGIVTAQWSIEPADASPEARQRARFIERAFDRMEGTPETILLQAMDAFSKGWSVQELVFSEADGSLWIERVVAKDPSRFGLELDSFGNISDLLLYMPGAEPQSVPRSKYAIFRNRARYGRPKGQSDLDAALPHWMAKHKLLAALNGLARNKAIIFPNDIELDKIASDSQASSGFLDAIDFHNREMARTILGQTLTTDEGKRVGSLALGKVHMQILLLQLQSLRRELADDVLTEQIIRPLVELNFGAGLVPRFKFEEASVSAFVTGAVS